MKLPCFHSDPPFLAVVWWCGGGLLDSAIGGNEGRACIAMATRIKCFRPGAGVRAPVPPVPDPWRALEMEMLSASVPGSQHPHMKSTAVVTSFHVHQVGKKKFFYSKSTTNSIEIIPQNIKEEHEYTMNLKHELQSLLTF